MGVVGLALLIAIAQPERLSGLVIDRIDVRAAPEEDVEKVLSLSGLRIGSPYSQSEIRRAVKVLFQTGRFENVYVKAKRAENAVQLVLELPPKPRIRQIDVAASEVLGSEELEAALGLRIGDEVDGRDLVDRRGRVKAALLRVGHRQPAVGLALSPIDENGGQKLIVRIDEGPETKLGKVVVHGRPRFPLSQLGRTIGLKSGDVLDLTEVERGLERLRERYVDSGYLDAKIDPPAVRESNRMEEGHPIADLILTVDSGPRVSLRFKGNHVVPRRELEDATGVLRELGTTRSAIAEARERILSRYEARGYFRARVEPAARTTLDGSRKQILFSIDEGKGARVAKVLFPGNISAIEEDDLREQIFDAVEQTLTEDLERPGADPNAIGTIMGDSSVGRRDTLQPANVAPDSKAIYVPRAYEAATSAIGDLYQARGYQNVNVGSPEVKERNGGSLIDVVIPIDPGVRWVVGALSFTGNEAVESEQLFGMGKFPFDPTKKEPVALSFEQVVETQTAIRDHYRALGHLYANVTYELRQVPARGTTEPAPYVTASQNGPLDAREVCHRAEEAGRETCEIEVNFRITEGPQVKAREVIVRGLDTTREGIVNSEIDVEEKGVLSETDLVSTRDNLLRVGVFERVAVHPIDEEQVAAEKDVVVEVKERKHWSVELGGGASTEQGVRLFAGFGHSNVAGTALRFQSSAKVNYFLEPFLVLYNDEARAAFEDFLDDFNTAERIEFEVAGGLSYPRIFGLPRGFSAGIDLIGLRDIDPNYAETAFIGTLVGNYKGFRPELLGRQRPVTFQLRAALERALLDCNAQTATITASVQSCTQDNVFEGDTFYATFGPRVSWDLRDDPLDPRQGAFFEVGFDVAAGLDSKTSPHFFEVEGRASVYLPLHDRIIVNAAFHSEYVRPFDPDAEIPANKRPYDRGRIRGYQLRTLLPQDVALDDNGKPVFPVSAGGELFLALQTEIRFQIYGPLWISAFYDVGDLWADGTPDLETNGRTLAQGAGVGVKVSTPIGPLSVDFAVPVVERDPGATGLTIHFSVGTF
jgi:outer membrane protein assembly factor BamA